ncbi:MAG TPA: ABC transporter permease [Patescibacteria group bacterium]|nr:ABC transporter permease [Patescibacteria group bacterium]
MNCRTLTAIVKFLWLILRSLRRNRRRNLLTAMSIAVSIFMFCGLASIAEIPALLMRGNGASRRLVCSNAAGMTYWLPESYARKISALPHVKVVQAWEFMPSQFANASDQFLTYGIDPVDMLELWPEWGVSPSAATAFEHQRTAALVGPEMMRRHKWRVGQQIIVHGTIPAVDVAAQIVGELNPAPSASGPLNMFVIRRDYLEALKGNRGLVTLIWAQTDNLSSIDPVIASIDETFSNSEHQTRTEAEGQFTRNVFSSLASIFTLASILGVIVVGVVTLVAANTAAMSIRERGRELAVMRAIGFRAGSVLVYLVSESSIVAIAGGVLGGLITWIVLGRFAPSLPGVNVPLPMSKAIIPLGVGLAWLVGVVSAMVPAWFALRRTIVEGLRLVA